jgi:hypothetical protein
VHIYLVVVLGLDTRHELEELLQKVVVIFHPAQLAKRVEMMVYNVRNVSIVDFLLIVVDMHHPQCWAHLLARHSLLCTWIRDVLDLHQELISVRYKLVHFYWKTRHLGSATSHVHCKFDIAPPMDMLSHKVLQVRVLVHLGDQSWKEVGRQFDELDTDTAQATVSIGALRALQTSFANVTRSAFVSLEHAMPAGRYLSHIVCRFGDFWFQMSSEHSAAVLTQGFERGSSRRFRLWCHFKGHLLLALGRGKVGLCNIALRRKHLGRLLNRKRFHHHARVG